jgi:anti-anti-sigma factor
VSWQHIHDYLWGGVDHGDPTQLRFAGDFDLATVGAADRFFSQCVEESSGALVLDLSRVGFMDASGVAFLARAQTYAHVNGRCLSLRSPSRAVTRVLDLGLVPELDLGAPPLLQPVNNLSRRDVTAILELTVERAIALDHAQRGSAQIFDAETGALRLIAAPGFSRTFREFFDSVHDESGASCGVAAADQRIVAVSDVTTSPIFVGTPSLDVMLDDSARACVSIPVIVDGAVVGMVSTHHDRPNEWSTDRLRELASLATTAAHELRASAAA